MHPDLASQLVTELKTGTPVILINTSDVQYTRENVCNAARTMHRELLLWNGRNRETTIVSVETTNGENQLNKVFDKKVARLLRKKLQEASNRDDPLSDEEIETASRIIREQGYREEIEPTELPDSGSDEDDILKWFDTTQRKNFIIILEDGFYDKDYNHRLPAQIRHLTESLLTEKTLIFIHDNNTFPETSKQYVKIINTGFPDKKALSEAYWQIVNPAKIGTRAPEKLICASQGLTLANAKRIYRSILVENGKVTDEEVPNFLKKKAEQMQCSCSISLMDTSQFTEESIGGFDTLKAWLKERVHTESADAGSFGITEPKGILLLGPPGTGKSLAAKTMADIFKRPLFYLNIGSIFYHWMGSSEQNIQAALATADAAAPCVLWIDEIEKCLAGSETSDCDGGTAARVFGILINWLSERQREVFVVATANNILALSPTLFRCGRFDEIFFLDLPNQKEREEIFSIHLAKCGHLTFTKEEIQIIAEKSRGFSGAEIETIVQNALLKAYNRDKILKFEDVVNAIHATSPMALRRSYDTECLRTIGKSCGITASSGKNDVDSLFQNVENRTITQQDKHTPSYFW